MKERFVNLDIWKLHLEREIWKYYSIEKEPHWLFLYSWFNNVQEEKKRKERKLAVTQLKNTEAGFPGGAVVKNPPANAGATGLSPGPGRTHMPRSN